VRDTYAMEKLTVYTDGGARGNPGPSGVGVVIYDAQEKVVKELSEYLGTQTNNFAEYEAVIRALKALKQLLSGKSKTTPIHFKMDSELIVRQLNRRYQVKEAGLVPQYMKVHNALIKDFGEVTFTHIPREENGRADTLANTAMDRGA
jgi:ribonuclease HI